MDGIFIAVIAILIVIIYIRWIKSDNYDRSYTAAIAIRNSVNKAQQLALVVKTSSQAALATDSPTESDIASGAAARAYNQIAAIVDECHVQFIYASKYEDTRDMAQPALDELQALALIALQSVSDASNYTNSIAYNWYQKS